MTKRVVSVILVLMLVCSIPMNIALAATCPKCGSTVKDGAFFCGACGARLSAAATPDLTQTPQPTATPMVSNNPNDFTIENGVLTQYTGSDIDVVIPFGVTSIGDWAFQGCRSLTSVSIPNGVTSIGCSAFWYCENLTNVDIPNSVTSIGDAAFAGCVSLTSVSIPANVSSIGVAVFGGCNKLSNIEVAQENQVYRSEGNCLLKGTELIQGCNNSVIPNDVTSIGFDAFWQCENLTSVDIPNSVTSIDDNAFFSCTRLMSISIPANVTSIGEGILAGCDKLSKIEVAQENPVYYSEGNCLLEGTKLIQGCNNSAIPNGVTSISNDAFMYCESLTSVDIPNTVTSIGNRAFYYCKSLTSVNIPDSVTSIGDEAFNWCENLKEITIPQSVTSIGEEAFESEKNRIIIYCVKGSYAEQYARANRIVCVTNLPNETTEKMIQAGDYVTFGTYPQTESGNDSTPIEWLVLEVDEKENKALLLSRYGLDAQPYNTEWIDVTWETCTLRKWLNGMFMNKVFNGAEQSAILMTNVDNGKSQGFDFSTVIDYAEKTIGGNNTQDKIFLLSYEEANKYLNVTWENPNNTSCVAPTAYAIKHGASINSTNKTADGKAVGWWWLRSPGCNQRGAASVFIDGTLFFGGGIDSAAVVRPTLWVNLESGIF